MVLRSASHHLRPLMKPLHRDFVEDNDRRQLIYVLLQSIFPILRSPFSLCHLIFSRLETLFLSRPEFHFKGRDCLGRKEGNWENRADFLQDYPCIELIENLVMDGDEV
ncbi:hypothetical protein ACP275_10G014800 [Erythranthe tilingii]